MMKKSDDGARRPPRSGMTRGIVRERHAESIRSLEGGLAANCDRIDRGASSMTICMAFGMSPVQFGMLMLIICALGLNTPPVGTTQFVGCAIRGVSVAHVMRTILPFYGALIAALLLVTCRNSLCSCRACCWANSGQGGSPQFHPRGASRRWPIARGRRENAHCFDLRRASVQYP